MPRLQRKRNIKRQTKQRFTSNKCRMDKQWFCNRTQKWEYKNVVLLIGINLNNLTIEADIDGEVERDILEILLLYVGLIK